MLFGYLTLFTALILSISAAVYSILGLTAIFAAAFWPIVILGGSLEFGKIVTTLWLHKYLKQAQLQYKIYLCSAVAILMLLTSMGVFGFLSKAHTDQSLVSGDVQSKIAINGDYNNVTHIASGVGLHNGEITVSGSGTSQLANAVTLTQSGASAKNAIITSNGSNNNISVTQSD
jgi:hypothetical protein